MSDLTTEVFRLVGIYRHTGDREAFDAALEELYKPPPELTCSWCGCTESQTDDYKTHEWPGLTDITIEVAHLEEGQSYVKRWVCANEFHTVMDGIKELGFTEHHHGGICFLEADDEECGGYGKCTLREED